MSETRNRARLCFIHIPKTAGASLTYHLKRQFAAADICPARYHAELTRLPPDEFARYRLFTGHFSMDARHLLGSPIEFATMLRDPVARVVSVYKFLRYFVAHYQVETTAPEMLEVEAQYREELPKGLTAFVKSPKTHVRRAVFNAQTAALGGGDPDQIDRNTLQRAKDNLRSCAAIGVTERMRDSLDLLAYRFGWPPLENLHINETPRGNGEPGLETGHRALIEEHNALDIELYAFATELFAERYAAMQEALSREFPGALPVGTGASTDGMTHLVERHYAASFDPNTAVSAAGVMPLDFGPVGSGWHPWERHGAGGFRWTGPGTRSVLDLVLPQGRPSHIGFHIVAEAAPGLAQSARLALNGRALDTRLLPLDEGIGMLQATVTPEQIDPARPFQRLTLLVSGVGTATDRALGLAITALSLT